MYEVGKVTSVAVVRLQLDTMTLLDIRFSPYKEHKE